MNVKVAIIINYLKYKGVSRYKISQDTKISQSTLSKWCSGQRKPSERLLAVLEDYYVKKIREYLK